MQQKLIKNLKLKILKRILLISKLQKKESKQKYQSLNSKKRNLKKGFLNFKKTKWQPKTKELLNFKPTKWQPKTKELLNFKSTKCQPKTKGCLI